MSEADYELQALRYLTGELTAGEQEQFEQLLVEDEQVAEAFGETSRVLAALSADHATVSAGPQLPVSSRIMPTGWSRLLLATALTFVVGLFLGRSSVPTSPPASLVDTTPLTSSERDRTALIAAAWIDLQSDVGSDEIQVSVLDEVDPDFEIVTADSAEVEELNVPNWMIAALQSQRRPPALPEVSDEAPQEAL